MSALVTANAKQLPPVPGSSDSTTAPFHTSSTPARAPNHSPAQQEPVTKPARPQQKPATAGREFHGWANPVASQQSEREPTGAVPQPQPAAPDHDAPSRHTKPRRNAGPGLGALQAAADTDSARAQHLHAPHPQHSRSDWRRSVPTGAHGAAHDCPHLGSACLALDCRQDARSTSAGPQQSASPRCDRLLASGTEQVGGGRGDATARAASKDGGGAFQELASRARRCWSPAVQPRPGGAQRHATRW